MSIFKPKKPKIQPVKTAPVAPLPTPPAATDDATQKEAEAQAKRFMGKSGRSSQTFFSSGEEEDPVSAVRFLGAAGKT